MSDLFDVIAVGAGQASAQLAISLRQGAYGGRVLLIGDEPDPPYERPPLSKDYLAGTRDATRLALRPDAFWRDRKVDLLLGEMVVALDPARRTVTTASRRSISFGTLVWAAGGRARKLRCAGSDLNGVHAVRTRRDVDRLRADLSGAERVVIVGGGYIGLETAAVLVKTGVSVTLLEYEDRVLARVAAEPVSRFYEREHRAAGVDLRLASTVAAVVGDTQGRVRAVRLTDGVEIAADLVIVGIGIAPAVEPMTAAGAATSNGVDVDAHCRTTLDGVLAIGDCANHVNRFADGRIRLESVQNAVDQAKVVADGLLGRPRPYSETPWFWSHQFDLKLQTVGISRGHDRVVVRGDPASRSWSLVYLKEGRVLAIDCINAVRDYVQGKQLVERAARADPILLADLTVPLKQLCG